MFVKALERKRNNTITKFSKLNQNFEREREREREREVPRQKMRQIESEEKGERYRH